ncbi:hypothetical protein N2152v2_003580 [Parachlorella kessleri]
MASWTPSEQGVHQICSLLSDFQKPGTNQAQILAQLDQCKQFPDFNNYLAFIFANGEGLPVEVRQSAGLLLKNNLKAQYASLSEEYKAFVKAALLLVLGHSSKPLRHTAGTCVVVIAGQAGVASWPQLVGAMAEGLDSGDPARVEGVLDTLYKISEEHPLQLEAKIEGTQQRPNDVLVPRILSQLGSPTPDIRALAVGVGNLLTNTMPAALIDNMDRFLQGLFTLAHDPSPAVRKAVCTGLVAMLMAMPERLEPSMGDLIEYMLQSTQDGDEGVAVESCEFWSAFCESQIESEVLRPFLPRLLPVLLKNMVWEEWDEEVQQAEALEEEALAGRAQADKEEEIKPFIHRSATHGEGGGDGPGGDDDDDDDEEVSQWNLRRCSAAGLDMLSTVFGDELLPIILPIVQQRLQGSDWRARESAILALGAVSEGCATGLTPFLPDMVALLLPTLQDPRPLVRCISCWALGRYAKWILERADGGQRGELDAVVTGICGRCLDHNRRVQEAACSALCTLVEEGEERLKPYLPAILQTIAAALSRYGKKNQRLAYDAASTVAERSGSALAETPALAATLLPPLFARLRGLPDGDRELLPVMECLVSVCQKSGAQLEPWAEDGFFRCVGMVERAQAAAASGAFDPEEANEFVVSALDVLGGMTEGLGPSIESLVGRSPLRELLLRCCKDPSPDVRQSGFALVGDLAKACAAHLKPILRELVAEALHNLEPQMVSQATISACNNACWCLGGSSPSYELGRGVGHAAAAPVGGELVLKSSVEEVGPLAVQVVERLLPIMQVPAGGLPRSLVENAAITTGRVGWVCPEPLAPLAPHFLGPWCSALRGVRDDVEKEHAFMGLCAVLRLNPQGALPSFVPLCEALVSWKHIGCEGLRNDLIQLMQVSSAIQAGVRAYKQQLGGAQWEQAMAALSQPARQKLQAMYGV